MTYAFVMEGPSISFESHSTSHSLLDRVRQHDEGAWQRFWQLYGPLIYSWARRSGLQDSDSADVAQNVFVTLNSHLERYDASRPGASFRGWLWGVVRNKLREHVRQRQSAAVGKGGSNQQLNLTSTQIPDDEPSPAEVTNSLARRALDLIRTDFSEQTWEIFWRTAMAGDSPREVSDELGVSVASVYTAKSRVLKHLRIELEGIG